MLHDFMKDNENLDVLAGYRTERRQQQQQGEAGTNTAYAPMIRAALRRSRFMAAKLLPPARLTSQPRWNAVPQRHARQTIPTAGLPPGLLLQPQLSAFVPALCERASSRTRRQALLPQAT